MTNKIYRVTLTLTTAITAQNKYDAMDSVHDSLPLDFEFGEFGNILPFNFEGLSAEQITDEDIGRG